MEEDELIAARHPQRIRVRPSDLVAAIIVAVIAAVVVFAVALVGHGHAQPAKPLRPASPATPHHPAHAVRDVLAGNRIGSVKFGQSRAAVIAALTPLLGPTSSGYARVQPECGVDHTITWPDWAVVSAHGAHYAFDPLLTVFFNRSRFVGYQYGEFGTKAAPRAPSRGTVLATTRGLNIGDTLARGRELHGSTFRLSSAQGGVWKTRRLRGYAWGTPSYGDASPQSVVATIDAGDVGCPALSP
jgi:hypothetical protein